MITGVLSGGLGNQMFQYAAAYSLAQKQNTPLQLDLSEFARYPLRDFMLDRYNLPVDITLIDKKIQLPLRVRKLIAGRSIYCEPHFHFDPGFFELSDTTTLHGYFQSERYFEKARNKLRPHFTLKEDLSPSSAAAKKRIEQAPVAVSLHVRRGDYVSDAKTQQVHGSTSEAYYKQAITKMEDLYGRSVTFFIFSDEPDYAEKEFSFCKNIEIIRGNDETPHEDMYLMSCCDHHILANSSFSWWGAWLNESADKTVMAPEQWFSSKVMLEKDTKDLFPKGWVAL